MLTEKTKLYMSGIRRRIRKIHYAWSAGSIVVGLLTAILVGHIITTKG